MAGALAFIAGIAVDGPRAQERRPADDARQPRRDSARSGRAALARRPVRLLHARARRLESQPPDHPHLDAGHRRRIARPDHQRRSRRVARALVAGQPHAALPRPRRRWSADLPRACRRRRAPSAHAPRHQRSTAAPRRRGRPTAPSIYFLAADPATDVERERERLRDDVFAFEEDYKQRHLWKVDVATGVEQKLTDGAILRALVPPLARRHAASPSSARRRRSPATTRAAKSGSRTPPARTRGRSRATASRSSRPSSRPTTRECCFIADANDAARAVLQPGALRRPRGRRAARRCCCPTSRTPSSTRRGARRSRHRRRREHGRAQRDRLGSTCPRRTARAADRRPALGAVLERVGGRDGWCSSSTSRRGSATRGRCRSRAARPRASPASTTRSSATSHLPRQEKVTWKGADGVDDRRAALLSDRLSRPAAAIPLVVQLHGGPQESDKFGFGPGVLVNYVPVLTAKGYAVLRPNYRGSTGYGRRVPPRRRRRLLQEHAPRCAGRRGRADQRAASPIRIGWR